MPAYKIVSMQACFITGVISTKRQNDNSYYKWHRVSFKIDHTKAQYLKPQVREAVCRQIACTMLHSSVYDRDFQGIAPFGAQLM